MELNGTFGRFSALMVFVALVLSGCPKDDDIVEQPDSLGPKDILLDFGGGTTGGSTDFGSNTGGQDEGADVPDPVCSFDADCQDFFEDIPPCEVPRCDKQSSKCILEGADDSAPCDDGDACTETECKSGVCTTTSDVSCDDGNQCTADICSPTAGCQSINQVGTTCDDGDECTENDICNDGVCFPGQLICGVELGSEDNPGNNCAHIKTDLAAAGTGTYWVATADGEPTQVFCDMTTAGGGWIRIAVNLGDIAVCSFADGLGDASQLAESAAASAAYSPSLVSELLINELELLVKVDQGFVIYKSSHADWKWSNIASGTINSTNLDTYAPQASTNGTSFELLKSPGQSPSVQGPALLGGVLSVTGGSAIYIGVGAQFTGTFVQDEGCQAANADHTGVYAGQAYPPTGWKTPAAIYVR